MEEDADDTAHDPAPGGLPDGTLAGGTEVGGYLIDGELGRGGMGIVYAATHPVIGKRVAIKVLRPSLSESPAATARFVQEARAVNQIGHPNIVDIFAFGQLSDGRCYLVMDLLVGESLRVRLKRGALPVDEAATVLDEIASALIAAHDKGFIHRDLKPDNVFLVAGPGRVDVKLLDFGLAKLMSAAGTRVFRTATGAQLGTPDYMSPEQLRASDNVDPRSDIFSLGITTIEALTGRRPRRFSDGTFEGGSAADRLAGVPGAPPALVQLVAAMVAPDPAARPALAAVRAAIRQIRSSLPASSAIAQAPPAALAADVPAMSASALGAKPVLPTPPRGTEVPPAAASPAVRRVGSHGGTKLGVPPPPVRVSGPISAARPAMASPARRRVGWLVVAIAVLVAAAIALVLALA